MLRSMTGFGSASGEQAGLQLRVELRSVNHRFLQLKTRLPQELAGLESEVEARVRQRLERGAVTVNINAERSGAARMASIDFELAASYAQAAEDFEARFGLDFDEQLSLDAIFGLPGVVSSNQIALSDEQGRSLLALVEQAVSQLVEMREAEGRAVHAELSRHNQEVARLTQQIEARLPELLRAQGVLLAERLAKLLGTAGVQRVELSAQDLARELALLADKGDVREELARLESHVTQFAQLLESRQPVGRKLDFLVQEFLREANTIGSKSADAVVAHLVVDLKTAIERLREQVQNVE